MEQGSTLPAPDRRGFEFVAHWPSRCRQVRTNSTRRWLEALARKCKEQGIEGELQQTLALIDQLTQRRIASDRVHPAASVKTQAGKRRARSGPTPQPHLPTIEQIYELDDADHVCPSCGGELSELDGLFEESELIDVVEVGCQVKKVLRQEYICRCGGCVETAFGPERATDGGFCSLAFAAKVATDEYLDHIPCWHARCVSSSDTA